MMGNDMDPYLSPRLRRHAFIGLAALVALSPLPAFVACSSSSATQGGDGGSDAAGDAMKPDRVTPDGAEGGATPLGVLQHHADGTRGGFYVDPAFTKKAIPGLESLPGFRATLTSSVFSQVLFLQNGAKGTDALYIVDEANDVIALDADTGAEIWKTNLGTPEPQSAGPTFEGSPCGTVWPLGITGTPIIDLPSRSIFVTAM